MAKINRSPQPKRFRLSSIQGWWERLWAPMSRFLSRNPRFTGLLIVTLGLSLFIILVSLLPSTQVFEGSLTLRSLSFTSAATQPLLKNAQFIAQLTGIGAQPLPFSGTFSGNPALKGFTKLEFKPIDDRATWQIEGKSGALLEVVKLELAAQTVIKPLRYDAYNKRLSLIIQPAKDLPATLILSANGEFKVTVQGYRSSPSVLGGNSAEFTWQPNNQLLLPIQQPLQLELQFSQPSTTLFWGNLAVQQVEFNEAEVASEAYANNYMESAVTGGTIRLGDKNYSLEDGQFLTFDPVDSIRSLLRLRLSQETASTLKTSDDKALQIGEPTQGLKMDISGKTKRIKIGLNKNLPVANLQASWLESFLPRDAAIALIAFLSALVSTLIGWLFELASSNEN